VGAVGLGHPRAMIYHPKRLPAPYTNTSHKCHAHMSTFSDLGPKMAFSEITRASRLVTANRLLRSNYAPLGARSKFECCHLYGLMSDVNNSFAGFVIHPGTNVLGSA
jgi:hypothetical protein